jgi:hypothetical protein
LPNGERDTSVGADERLLERDRIRLVPGHEVGDGVEDRLQTALRTVARRGSPQAVVDRPEAAVAFVTMPYPHAAVPGSMPTTLHGQTLGGRPDVPSSSINSALTEASLR